jgi:secreted trypsin-like serine protease
MWKEFFLLIVILNSCFGVSWVFNKIEKDESTKIVGGKKVDIKEAPFTVLIMTEGRPLCGASIISARFFLTVR